MAFQNWLLDVLHVLSNRAFIVIQVLPEFWCIVIFPGRNIHLGPRNLFHQYCDYSPIFSSFLWSQGHLVINRVLYYQWFLFFSFSFWCANFVNFLFGLGIHVRHWEEKRCKDQAYLCTRCQQCSDPFGSKFSSSLWVGAVCHKLSVDLHEWGLKWSFHCWADSQHPYNSGIMILKGRKGYSHLQKSIKSIWYFNLCNFDCLKEYRKFLTLSRIFYWLLTVWCINILTPLLVLYGFLSM